MQGKKLSGKLVNMLPTFISRWLMRVYKCVARKCYPRSDTLLLHELLDSRVKYSIYFWPKNRPFKNHIMLECELLTAIIAGLLFSRSILKMWQNWHSISIDV